MANRANTIRAVQEFFSVYGRCREVQLTDASHDRVLLSIEQIPAGIDMLGAGATGAPGLWIRYRGQKKGLIALGCISHDRLAAMRHARSEDDPRGAMVHVESKSAPGRRGAIELSYFTHSRSFAGMLPAVRTYCADWLETLTARPMLRLVVDNTKSKKR